MERNTCYLNLSVAEAARTVSELVERAGLSSRMVDCHELRQGENLGMVLLFEKYFLRMGSRLTLTAVLDNLEGAPGSTGRSPAARNAPAERRQQNSGGEYSEALRRSCSLSGRLKAGGKRWRIRILSPWDWGGARETIHAAVTDSITGELVDHYELTHPGGGTCGGGLRSTTTGRATGSPSPWSWTTCLQPHPSTVSAEAGVRTLPL